jgi:N-methylhydantoinase A/oxoprolinase/acetone carboxylase beta subunit
LPANEPTRERSTAAGGTAWRIGVDTGGTFTDLVMLGPGGLSVHKVRSTPDDPSRAIVTGILEIAGRTSGADVVHGSTVATNAVLERTGARVALVATAGFEDVVRIGRQTRRELYNLTQEDRRPLVEPGLTFGIRERVDADGSVFEPLDQAAARDLAVRLREAGVRSVAICLLHSYRNPVHEQHATEILAAAGLQVSASHRILREYREYERWSTTIVNAYVTPLVSGYLGALAERLEGSRLSIMQSNGGSIAAATARSAAVRTILSGPAAGVVGARAVAEAAGYQRVITFDMGGTSTDVSLVDGAISTTTESMIGDFPVRLPIIDIHTVGAGGGSIASLDSGGALRVGPQSAGADPGPACYGKGTALTVTDANLLLGRLDPDYFLGGRMTLDPERASLAAAGLAASLGVSVPALAEGVVRVANAGMERAIRVVSVQRGHDPREFALLAFGGAGGMHACEIADRLDVPTVIVPKFAGVLSALGTLAADVTKDYSLSILRAGSDASLEQLTELLQPLIAEAEADLAREGFSAAAGSGHIRTELDVRYLGQSYEITVACTAGYREEFDSQHARRYGYSNPQRPVEVVNLRVMATGVTRKPALPRSEDTGPAEAVMTRRGQARFAGKTAPTAFYRWENLAAGACGSGPAVVAGAQATAVVPPGFSFRIDGFGNLLAVRAAGRRQARRGAAAAPAS